MDENPVVEAKKPSGKGRIFYPVLFAIFPVLSIYSANLSLVPFGMIIRPVVAVAIAAFLVWGLLSLILRRLDRGAAATAALTLMLLTFVGFNRLLYRIDIPQDIRPNVWLGTTIVVVLVSAFVWRWHKLLNIVSASLVLAAIGQIAFGLVQAATFSPPKTTNSTPITLPKERPDIIYIILDGYGRSDALKRAMGFNNDAFIQGLESRGFYVAKDAHSNYCQTELSVSSSLNFDLLQSLLPNLNDEDNDRSPLGELIDHNAAADYLHKRGYVFAAITSKFPPIQLDDADINMKTRTGYTLIESALLQMTPFTLFQGNVTSLFDQRRATMRNEFEALESLASTSAKPRFVVMHVLAPHPPFVFDKDGNPTRREGPFGYWDGSDFIDHVGTPEDYRQGYMGQAEYVGKRLLKSLDVLFAKPGLKPVVIVQGDHGSKLRLDQNSYEHTDVDECFPNLNAYFVPDSVRKNLYPGITPVNSFRILFNGLFGDNLPLRPDRSWYSTYPKPYDFIEVTNRLADHEKMPTVPLPKFPPRPPASDD